MMMSTRLWRRTLGVALIGVAGVSRPAPAQAASTEPTSELETRAMLEAEAKKAEAAHRTQEAWLLKSRLQKGDFQDGDRIVVKLLGATMLLGSNGNDTVTVRAGKMLPLPQMADLPLEGVLRSELTDKLMSHLAKYLRDSSVRATPLVRLAVLGQVRSPGYYYTSVDVLLSDVVMKAGGPNATADVGKMIIRRGGETIWNAEDTRTALADGLSLERLHLRAGDELYVDDMKGSINWVQMAQYAAPLLGLFYYARNIFR